LKEAKAKEKTCMLRSRKKPAENGCKAGSRGGQRPRRRGTKRTGQQR